MAMIKIENKFKKAILSVAVYARFNEHFPHVDKGSQAAHPMFFAKKISGPRRMIIHDNPSVIETFGIAENRGSVRPVPYQYRALSASRRWRTARSF
jgi:hypothetical protein